MQPKIPLTQARLKELLHYDPETGVFTWRVGRVGCRAGSIAGSLNGCGYRQIGIDRRMHLLHRIAFLYVTGGFPQEELDHINGVRDDNRWVNLREATGSENRHNLGGPPSHNTSGFLGVYWCKRRQKWVAEIKLRGRKRHLGYFDTAEEAHATYLKAKDELHPTHQRLRRAA